MLFFQILIVKSDSGCDGLVCSRRIFLLKNSLISWIKKKKKNPFKGVWELPRQPGLNRLIFLEEDIFISVSHIFDIMFPSRHLSVHKRGGKKGWEVLALAEYWVEHLIVFRIGGAKWYSGLQNAQWLGSQDPRGEQSTENEPNSWPLVMKWFRPRNRKI